MALLSTEQVADRLGLSSRTIREYIRDGRIRHYKFGTERKPVFKIPEEAIAEFLETCEVPTLPIDPNA